MNFRLIENYISKEEQKHILEFVSCFQPEKKEIENPHIKEINDYINGYSVLCDMTNTEISKEVSRFQGDSTLVEFVPHIFHSIKDRISDNLRISKDHVFFQLIVMNAGGKVAPHYDAGMPGYVTYKVNINIESTTALHVDKMEVMIKELDLYAFEANLFKHWADPVTKKTVLLSYGYILPQKELGWDDESPRIKLSNRIWKHFINHK